MRVAIIAPPWVPIPPPAYGGTETMLDTLARGLVVAGHEVLLFATGDSTCPVPKAYALERSAGVGTAGAATELRHVIEAYEVVRDFDVVHDHTLVGPVYAERFPRLRLVTTNHGPFRGELGVLYRAIAASVAVIAISHHHASTAVGTPIAAVIHHGVEVDRFPFGAGDGAYAAFLGRMNPDKGVDAAARIARRAGVPLRIAAKMREPAEFAYFEEKVRPLLGHGVEYVGEVGGRDKLDLLAGAVCLLNPIAWDEPFGMVMVEALACGTPVLATPRGSVPELVADGVTGFVRATEEALAQAMADVATLDRARCRKEAEVRFGAERMVHEHLDLYASPAHHLDPSARVA